jgi:hypothetical protein
MQMKSRTLMIVPALCLALLAPWRPAGAAVAASGAQTAAAPLDTFITEPQVPAPDPRYAQPHVEISRRVLPEMTGSAAQTGRLSKQPPRLDDPLGAAVAYRQARQAAMSDDPGGAMTSMAAALEAAPGQPRYQLWSVASSVRAMDTATLAKVLPASVRSLVDSPIARGPLVIATHQGLLLATTIFWTVLVAALWLGRWRLLAHDLSATLLKDRRHRPRLVMPVLILLVALLLRPGWLGLLALLSVPVLVRTRGRRHNLLMLTWLCALCLTFPNWPLLREAVPVIDPASEVTLLLQGSTLPPSASLIDALNRQLAQAEEPARKARLLTALGIQEARRGAFAASNARFQEALKHEPYAFAATVGIANNRYYLGELDDSATAYREAASRWPNRGEIPFNLAQVQFKKLFVPEATASLDRARQLGFDPPRANHEPNPRGGFSAVVYPGLTDQQLKAACTWEGAGYPPLVTVSAWRNLLGAPPVPLYLLVGAPLLLGLLATAWAGRKPRHAHECDNCGAPLCRACSGVHDGACLCAACNETAIRSRSDLVLGTLLKNRGRTEGLAHSARIVRMGRVVPGSGHLATGCFWGGWMRLSMVSFGLFLIAAAWAFDPGAEWNTPGLLLPGETINPAWFPLPSAAWPGLHGLPVMLGAVLLCLVWLTAMLDAPTLRRRLHERFTTITGNPKKQPARRAGAVTR